MINIFTKVEHEIWEDPDFIELNSDSRLLFLYILTCGHRNLSGMYYLPVGYIVTDLEWTKERVREPFAILLDKGFISYDDKRKIVLIRNFLKHNRIENVNQATKACKMIKKYKESLLMHELREILNSFNVERHQKIIDYIDTLCEPLPIGYGKQGDVDGDVNGDVYVDGEEDGEEDGDGTQSGHHEGYQILLNQYNKNCPSLKRKNSIDANMKRYLNAVYKSAFKSNPIESIKFFQRIENSDYLTGRAKDFKAEFEWLFKDENLVKIQNGKYDKFKSKE